MTMKSVAMPVGQSALKYYLINKNRKKRLLVIISGSSQSNCDMLLCYSGSMCVAELDVNDNSVTVIKVKVSLQLSRKPQSINQWYQIVGYRWGPCLYVFFCVCDLLI